MLRGHIWPLVAGKRQKKMFLGPLWVHAIWFFTFTGLLGHKMTPHQKTQKNPILNRFFLYLMWKGHFWPLEAGKRKKKYFWFPRIRFFTFCGLQRPKMTPLHKTQKNDFEKIFLYLMLRGHIWPLVARKNGKRKGFWVHGIRFYPFCCLQRPKMTPSQKTQKIPILKRIF